MNMIALQIAILGSLVLLNALFSMSEMALMSSRRSRLQQMANEGKRGASEAFRIAQHPNRFLSTIQIGMTLMGVLSGAFGGATLAKSLGAQLSTWFSLNDNVAQAFSIGIVVAGITSLIVILGELFPKRLALRNSERIAALVAYPMRFISGILFPIVWIFTKATDLLMQGLGLERRSTPGPVTHEEIKAMVEQGAQEGGFDEHERMMMDRVLSFGRKRVTSLMTPTREIIWIDILLPIEEQIDNVLSSHYSHYPVAEGNLDQLLGTVQAKDLCQLMVGNKKDLASLYFQPLYIPETSNARQVLEELKKTGLQMGFVIDEFGAIQGIVTLTNILEAIVGDIPSQGVPEDSPIMKRADGSWLLDGSLPIEEMKEGIGIHSLGTHDRSLFLTVAGFIMHRLGRVPIQTDTFIWEKWRFEVVKMDKKRIDKVVVSEIGQAPENTQMEPH